MAMAEQSEVKRPSHRTVSMWSDLQAALGNVNSVAFLLGLLPEKPSGAIDWESVELQLDDARARLGALALALTEEVES